MKHLVNWIEIPVSNLERAKKFYSEILGEPLREMALGATRYALFASADRFNCGALVEEAGRQPSLSGVAIYLDGGKDLDEILQKVAKAGGKVDLEKTLLSKEAGFIAFFVDTEGNRVGLQNTEDAKPAQLQFLYVFRPKRDNFLQTMTPTEMKAFKGHQDYTRDLLDRGKIMFMGGCTDGAYGTVAFRAESPEEALQIFQNDPVVKAGIAHADLHPYQVTGFNLSLL